MCFMLNPNIFLGFQPPFFRTSAEGLKRWPSLPAGVGGAQRFFLPEVWLENHRKNKGTPPWGGCGFSTIVYLVIESKMTFSHCNLQYFMLVIYDVLTFAARCQNAKKMQFRNICLRFNAFFFSSVLFQSAFFVLKSLPKVWMYWCWCVNLNCKTSATKLGNVSSVASSYSRQER